MATISALSSLKHLSRAAAAVASRPFLSAVNPRHFSVAVKAADSDKPPSFPPDSKIQDGSVIRILENKRIFLVMGHLFRNVPDQATFANMMKDTVIPPTSQLKLENFIVRFPDGRPTGFFKGNSFPPGGLFEDTTDGKIYLQDNSTIIQKRLVTEASIKLYKFVTKTSNVKQATLFDFGDDLPSTKIPQIPEEGKIFLNTDIDDEDKNKSLMLDGVLRPISNDLFKAMFDSPEVISYKNKDLETLPRVGCPLPPDGLFTGLKGEKLFLSDYSRTPMRRLVDATAIAAYGFNEAAARAVKIDSSKFQTGDPVVWIR